MTDDTKKRIQNRVRERIDYADWTITVTPPNTDRIVELMRVTVEGKIILNKQILEAIARAAVKALAPEAEAPPEEE